MARMNMRPRRVAPAAVAAYRFAFPRMFYSAQAVRTGIKEIIGDAEFYTVRRRVVIAGESCVEVFVCDDDKAALVRLFFDKATSLGKVNVSDFNNTGYYKKG